MVEGMCLFLALMFIVESDDLCYFTRSLMRLFLVFIRCVFFNCVCCLFY